MNKVIRTDETKEIAPHLACFYVTYQKPTLKTKKEAAFADNRKLAEQIATTSFQD